MPSKWRPKARGPATSSRSPGVARRRCPRRRTGREAAAGRSAARSRAKSDRGRGSSGRRGGEDSVDRLVELQLGQVGDQRTRRSVAGAPAPSRSSPREPSTAITRPRGSRSISIAGDAARAAAGVEHGLVAAQRRAGRAPRRPAQLGVGDARRRSPRPSRGVGVHRPAHRQSAVVTGPRSAAPEPSKASIAAGVLQRDADVVEAVQQPVLDVGLDLELEDAGGAGDGLVVDVDPRLARLGDGPAVLLVEDRRQQADLGAVGIEDVGEGRRDDRLEAEVLQRPGGVLARGAAAEVAPRRPGSGSAPARSRRRGSSRRRGTRRSRSARPA